MLYIKDYGALNDLVPDRKADRSFLEELVLQKGKMLTVYTGSASFSGILTDVSTQRIVLTVPQRMRCRSICGRCGTRQVEITVGKIAGVACSFL